MDARPTPEQRQISEAAERLAAKLGPSSVGDLDDDDRRTRLDQALDQAGWRHLRAGTTTEPLASGVETALVARALARGACDTPFIGPVLAVDLLRRLGRAPDDDPALSSPAGREPTIAVSGDLSSLASSAEGALAVDAAGATTALALGAGPADPDGGQPASDAVVVALPVGEPAGGVDLTRAVAVVAAGGDPITLGELAPSELAAWTALGVALTAADLVGAMEGALALSVDYAAQRRQFNTPIGSFQAVQHLLAEARSLAEGASSAMLHAAWAVDALDPPAALAAAAVAKAYAARAARMVCESAIQVHGGVGNTWECLAHVFLRRTILATELLGGEEHQLDLVTRNRLGATDGLQ